MRALLISLWHFTLGIASRAYFWGFALFLDPGDIYGRLAPSDWWRPIAVPDPWPWVILATLVFWCAVLAYHEQRQRAEIDFVPDMDPKELYRYLWEDSKWGEQFDKKLVWFNAVKQAVTDELRQGRRLRCMARQPGSFGDGTFRYPADFVDREFWEHGELNWLRMIYVKGEPPIDAYDRKHERKIVDVRLCRKEVEAIWPTRNWLRRKLKPPKFSPFEDPMSRPPPAQAEGKPAPALEAPSAGPTG